MWEKKRIYVVVKTYPSISEEYSELVCTAGVLEDGSWIRLYPVPFRLLKEEQKYPKYTWINVEVEKNYKDKRIESYRPQIVTLEVEPKPKVNWDIRKEIIFNNNKIYTNMQELIDKAKNGRMSLAIFKPTKILELTIKPCEKEWDSKKINSLKMNAMQLNLFKNIEEVEHDFDFKTVKKIPYKFKYRFKDDAGTEHLMMIEDWEIGMLYLNCLREAKGNEEIATSKVRQKYFDEFLNKDLYFFLGTTLKHHFGSKNPFLIIGVFYPPKNPNITLFEYYKTL